MTGQAQPAGTASRIRLGGRSIEPYHDPIERPDDPLQTLPGRIRTWSEPRRTSRRAFGIVSCPVDVNGGFATIHDRGDGVVRLQPARICAATRYWLSSATTGSRLMIPRPWCGRDHLASSKSLPVRTSRESTGTDDALWRVTRDATRVARMQSRPEPSRTTPSRGPRGHHARTITPHACSQHPPVGTPAAGGRPPWTTIDDTTATAGPGQASTTTRWRRW